MFEARSMNVEQKGTETITDVSCSENMLEDRLVDLLEEQFPDYHLQADSLYLYDSQDWDHPAAHSKDTALSALSPILAEETFRYMILSSGRVEQMTKTYSDIDMVTHLLAERDRDLELAARIGQSLLQRNQILTERSESLEEQLAQACDQLNQLQHELSKKDELLRMVASTSEDSESDSSCSTPLRHNESFSWTQGLGQLEAMQNKLRDLEEENLSLRSEACHLKTETITYEEKEQQLVNDCVKELRESNSQIVALTDELSHKNEELVKHQEEIANLLSQIVDLQQRVKELAIEKEELRIHLQASKEAQRQLTAELHDLQERNVECLGMLHESQEEVRELRSKPAATSSLRRHPSYGLFPMDSLAAEIEGTMRRELSLDEELAIKDQRHKQKRVFDTVKSVNESVRSHPMPTLPPLPIPGSNQTNVIMTAQPFKSEVHKEQQLGERNGCSDNHSDDQEHDVSDTPRTSDLATALHRLSLRRDNYLSERQFFEDERQRKLKALAEGGDESSGCSTPNGSVFSAVTTHTDSTELTVASNCFRTFLPEKLQIVKPIEGSQTLHQWQQLAQPHLATILDSRPGVVTKGFKPLKLDVEYCFSDLEEDEEVPLEKEKEAEEEEDEEGGITFNVHCSSTPEEKSRARTEERRPASIFLPTTQVVGSSPSTSALNPGKCQSSTFSTYTFTTCRILHPSAITQVTPSSMYAPGSSGDSTPSSLRTGPSTPVTACRLSLGESFTHQRSSCTLSRTYGLAQLLQDRGISAQAYTTPVSKLFAVGSPKKAPTMPSTPPNSPIQSPVASPIPFESRSSTDNFLASRPAEIVLQEVYGLKPNRARGDLFQHKVNLVERLRRLGFAKVLKGAPERGLRRQESALFVAPGRGSLLDGLRRNQSLPVLIGGLGPQVSGPPVMDVTQKESPSGVKLPAAQ
ncbi:trafficking kinesin-binding protein 2 [Erpetoichthys calabaricus]|uniref:Trafficking kinesin protein 2 n=1 Tax=Erpetoichthys calabaricus TaxID=27687 RepID=A0A8C4S8G6_ERPCA|nr:trafficking kinesin-binding protein 2 [Erpetoichthys calabaricus]